MTKQEILNALNKREGTLTGTARTDAGIQIDKWKLNENEYLITKTSGFWLPISSNSPGYTINDRVELLTRIE